MVQKLQAFMSVANLGTHTLMSKNNWRLVYSYIFGLVVSLLIQSCLFRPFLSGETDR